MDLRQLRALVAVADHASFSAAARSLHTVQSNVSTHVARLERELGVILVERSTGKLTVEGEAVVERARRIEAELQAIDADLASNAGEIRGVVRMGVIGTTARWLVPALLRELTERYPRVQLIVIDATTTSLLPQVTSGRLDSAVVNLPINDPDIDTEMLFDEDRIVLAPPDHPLAAFDEIDLQTLSEHPIMLTPRGTTFRDSVDQEAESAGVRLKIHAEVDGMLLLASLAYEGFGPALLPASAAPSWATGSWKTVRVRGLTRRTVGLATYRRSAPAAPARAVRESLRAVIPIVAARQPGIHVVAPDALPAPI
jgi:LysR family hydrogen peroxide-inducible transcriptional activator